MALLSFCSRLAILSETAFACAASASCIFLSSCAIRSLLFLNIAANDSFADLAKSGVRTSGALPVARRKALYVASKVALYSFSALISFCLAEIFSSVAFVLLFILSSSFLLFCMRSEASVESFFIFIDSRLFIFFSILSMVSFVFSRISFIPLLTCFTRASIDSFNLSSDREPKTKVGVSLIILYS